MFDITKAIPYGKPQHVSHIVDICTCGPGSSGLWAKDGPSKADRGESAAISGSPVGQSLLILMSEAMLAARLAVKVRLAMLVQQCVGTVCWFVGTVGG